MLTIENLFKTYSGGTSDPARRVAAVNGIDLHVEEGHLFTLLGPSGCGKTTTLRCVAGLEAPDSGRITVGGQAFFDSDRHVRVPAHRRGLGMVFQSYAIWPHMNVFKNVAFPLTVGIGRGNLSKRQIAERVERVLGVVRLAELRDRPATDLSGGQQQRLALARALVMEPPLLLLDEPLSNLDAKLREEMRFELKRLQRDLGITAVYVTHDQVEALAMSNVIAIMSEGEVAQVGRPREVYHNPRTKFVADFIGKSNFLDGRILQQEPGDGMYSVKTPHGEFLIQTNAAVVPGDAVTVSIRPERIVVTEVPADQATDPKGWRGEVTARAFLGDAMEHLIRVDDLELLVRSSENTSIAPGTPVDLQFPPKWCVVIPADG